MARKRKFATTIRMGAAHNEVTTTDGKRSATLPMPRPDRRTRKEDRLRANDDLTSLGETLCQLHGIREPQKRNAKGHFEKRQPKPAPKVAKPRRSHVLRDDRTHLAVRQEAHA